MDSPNCRCDVRHVLKPVTIWARWRWQVRMAIAEKGLDFWFWLAGAHVPAATLEPYLKLLGAIPAEPTGWVRPPHWPIPLRRLPYGRPPHRATIKGKDLEKAPPEVLKAAEARTPGGFKLTGLVVQHDPFRVTGFYTALEGSNAVEIPFDMREPV